MSQELYNLGRVTGLSAYELNVKQQLSEYPDLPSMTEKEWIASTVTAGASLILKIPAGTSRGPHDFPLPQDSSLCSGNSLLAYPFAGQCECSSSGWATKVISYGPLISNTEDVHPVTPGTSSTDIPMSLTTPEDVEHMIERMKDYSKIVDGIIFQGGTWSDSETVPNQTFKPDFHLGSTIRIYFDEPTTNDIYVLFTGLVNKAVVAGAAKLDSDPVTSPDPQDGDFIGPEVYPWGSKIIFTVPTTVLRLYKCYVSNISQDPKYEAYAANIEMDGKTIQAISLSDDVGKTFSIQGTDGIVSSDLIETDEDGYRYITWQSLLQALWSNKSIDVLSDRLRLFRSFLPDVHTEENLYIGKKAEIRGTLEVTGESTFVSDTISKENTIVEKESKTKNLNVTDNYITVNGIRLYVASEQPDGEIPEGSLGIGW